MAKKRTHHRKPAKKAAHRKPAKIGALDKKIKSLTAQRNKAAKKHELTVKLKATKAALKKLR